MNSDTCTFSRHYLLHIGLDKSKCGYLYWALPFMYRKTISFDQLFCLHKFPIAPITKNVTAYHNHKYLSNKSLFLLTAVLHASKISGLEGYPIRKI